MKKKSALFKVLGFTGLGLLIVPSIIVVVISIRTRGNGQTLGDVTGPYPICTLATKPSCNINYTAVCINKNWTCQLNPRTNGYSCNSNADCQSGHCLTGINDFNPNIYLSYCANNNLDASFYSDINYIKSNPVGVITSTAIAGVVMYFSQNPTTAQYVQAAMMTSPLVLCGMYGSNSDQCQYAAMGAYAGYSTAIAQQASTNTLEQGVISIDKLHPNMPGYNNNTVSRLKDVLDQGGELPPVKITQYNGQYYTLDGDNRIAATMQSGGSTVKYEMIPYQLLDDTNQYMVQQLSAGAPILPIPAPNSYQNFPMFSNYNSYRVTP
jgi:hypothetical protein